VANVPLLLTNRSLASGTHDKILGLYRKANLHPKIIHTKSLPWDEAGAIVIAAGKGIAFGLGANACHPAFRDRIKALTLDESGSSMPVHIAWRKGQKHPTLDKFIKTTKGLLNGRMTADRVTSSEAAIFVAAR